MSEQISTELLKIMNEMANNETTIAKIDASIFIRNSKQMVNEKVAYLYNIIKIEAKNCNQRQEDYFDDVDLIISHYKQKLNMVYDEFYCKYVNIQNELQEAKNNKRIAMINYQKIINKQENGISSNNDIILKQDIKNKNYTYQDIIDMCNLKFNESKENFEKMINEEFLISSKSLQLVTEQTLFKRLLNRFANIFKGEKKYTEILGEYNKAINKIDSYEIVKQMREDTIEFVANILERRGIDGLDENVRIGG